MQRNGAYAASRDPCRYPWLPRLHRAGPSASLDKSVTSYSIAGDDSTGGGGCQGGGLPTWGTREAYLPMPPEYHRDSSLSVPRHSLSWYALVVLVRRRWVFDVLDRLLESAYHAFEQDEAR